MAGEDCDFVYHPFDDLDNTLMNLPEVQAGKGLWQNRHHQHHVFGHTCVVVSTIRSFRDERNIIAASWTHDIGKIPQAVEERDADGRPNHYDPDHPERIEHSFPNHEIVGASMVAEMSADLFSKLRLNQEYVTALVAAHYNPMMGIRSMRQTTTPEGFVDAFLGLDAKLRDGKAEMRDVLDIFYADRIGQGAGCNDRTELFAIRDVLLSRGEFNLGDIFATQQRTYHDRTPIISEKTEVRRFYFARK